MRGIYKWGAIYLLACFIVSLSGGCGQRSGSSEAPAASEHPYQGKTITLVVPFSPGGGYDAYARMMQPYIQKYTRAAAVVVQNIPGAGSIIGCNAVYTAKPDGLTIGILGGTAMIFSQTAGTEGVKYDVSKFTYLGRVTSDPNVTIVSAKTPYKSLDDLRQSPGVRFSSPGVGDLDFYVISVLCEAFGIKHKMVTGWEGTSQMISALAAGSIDAVSLSLGTVLPPIQNGYARPILQVTNQRAQELPQVPTARELVDKASDPEALNVLIKCLEVDKLLVAPPGMDEANTKYWRGVVEQVLKDPEFLQKAKQAQRSVSYMEGNKVAETIKEALESAGKLKAIFDKAVSQAK